MSMHPKYEVGTAIHDELDQLWKEDPFFKDPNLTKELLNLYFKHINPDTYSIFPRDQFLRWIERDPEKSPEDLMVIYSILTLASRFYSGDRDLTAIQAVSHYAVGRQSSPFSLQLVQSRFFLAFSEYGFGRKDSAWDMCGSARRAASAIHLNLEEMAVADRSAPPFGLSSNSYAECRRRTFWALYIMDVSLVTELTKEGSLLADVPQQRFNGHVAGHVTTIHDVDSILRLPMEEKAFADSEPNLCISFQHLAMTTTKTTSTKLQGLGAMAHLVLISAIWNHVLGNLSRSMHKAGELYSEWYEDLIRESTKQLKVWVENLPPHLRYSAGHCRNLDYNISLGQGGMYVAMHSLYFTTVMKLNRHGRLQHMRHTLVAAIVRDAVHGAQEYLEFVLLLGSRDRSKDRLAEFIPPPCTGFAITTACDIISAKGRLRGISDTVEQISSGLSILEELSPFWAPAEAQKLALQCRIKDLSQLLPASSSDPKAILCSNDPFTLPTPMERTFRLDGDLIYSATVEAYLGALEGILSVNVSTSHPGHSNGR
jgi:hypothetical protein